METFLTNLIGGSGLDGNKNPKGTSPAVKALGDGNTWEHEDLLLAPFKPILGPDPFKKWVSWHKQGGDYLSLLDEVCPYCGQPASDVKGRIDAVGDAFTSAKVGNIEKILEAASIGCTYMGEAAVEKLNEIVDSAEPITDQ